MKSKRKWILLAALALGASLLFFASRFRMLVSPYRYTQTELLALEAFPYDDWELVLTNNVKGDGHVDFTGLLEDRAPLERFVALVGAIGPLSRPALFRSESQQRRYYLSVYNALVLFSLLDGWPAAETDDLGTRFFYSTRFVIDGHKANLYELEHQFLRREFPDLFRSREGEHDAEARVWNWSLAEFQVSAD